jgi:hypothetical protein
MNHASKYETKVGEVYLVENLSEKQAIFQRIKS